MFRNRIILHKIFAQIWRAYSVSFTRGINKITPGTPGWFNGFTDRVHIRYCELLRMWDINLIQTIGSSWLSDVIPPDIQIGILRDFICPLYSRIQFLILGPTPVFSVLLQVLWEDLMELVPSRQCGKVARQRFLAFHPFNCSLGYHMTLLRQQP
jgi:hypothetical protein